MKRTKWILPALLAAALIFAASLPQALAYFTAYTDASGIYKLSLDGSTTIDEPDVSSWTKHVVITNTGDVPVYIRARAYAASTFKLNYSGTGWTDGGDGFWYCAAPIDPKKATDELLIKIDDIPTDVAEGDGFNVAVIYESVPVRYDENGNPYADWTQDVITVQD